MINNRRSFLKKIALGGGLGALQGEILAEELYTSIHLLTQMDQEEALQNEDLWKRIQAAYTGSKSYINLNNGGVSPQPAIVLDAEKKYLELINEMPSLYLGRILHRTRFRLRKKLADLGGCKPEELAFMRNTTEAINTIMLGIDWQKGDEVVVSSQDYSTVQLGWKQLAKRYQLKLVWVNLPIPVEDEQAIVEAYTSKFTSKTKLVHLTHLINWTGQLIPSTAIATIAKTAKKQGIFSLVDGAHSFAHIDFKIEELHCDAYACSLHKWLSGPIGMGMLYLRKEQIPNIWSMYPSSIEEKDSIIKFEHKGTISMAKEEALYTAIEFHRLMGIELKEARLRYLKNYWVNQLKSEERVHFHTSLNPQYTGCMTLFEIKGMEYSQLSYKLENKYRIHHTTSNIDGVSGARISPNVYTSLEDLDALVEAIYALSKV